MHAEIQPILEEFYQRPNYGINTCCNMTKVQRKRAFRVSQFFVQSLKSGAVRNCRFENEDLKRPIQQDVLSHSLSLSFFFFLPPTAPLHPSDYVYEQRLKTAADNFIAAASKLPRGETRFPRPHLFIHRKAITAPPISVLFGLWAGYIISTFRIAYCWG